MTDIGRRDTWEQNASSVRNPLEDQRRAATGYLLWPLAAANLIRETDSESIWTRLHARQALVFGSLGSLIFVCVLAVPLIAVIGFPALSSQVTIDIYGVALSVDIAAAIGFVVCAARYAARAARGELFSIPLVTPLVDALFRLRAP